MTAQKPKKARKGKPTHRQPFYDVWAEDDITHIAKTGESTLETGARFRLYDHAATEKPPGTLPDDDVQLARWAGVTAEEWGVMKGRLTSYWKRNARTNRWVIRRIVGAAKRSSRISDAKTAAADARWSRRNSQEGVGLHARASQGACSSMPESMLPNSPPNSLSGSTYVDPPNPNARAGALASPSSAVAGSGPAARPRPPALSRAFPHAAAHPRIRSAVPDHPAVEAYVGIVGETPIQALWGRIAEAVGENPDRIQAWVDHLVWWCSQGYNRSNVAGILDQWELRDREDPEPRNGKTDTPRAPISPEGVARISDLVASVSRSKTMEGSK